MRKIQKFKDSRIQRFKDLKTTNQYFKNE